MFPVLMSHLRVARRGPGRPRTRPVRVCGDKAYSSRAIRRHLRVAVIPEPADQQGHRARRGSKGGLIETKTVSQVRNLLYSCFNCYFPVAGAPASFPASNQFLPLEVGPIPGVLGWNFNCYMDTTYYDNQGNGWAWFGYRFRAAAGHVDGLGSTIDFSFNPAWNQSNPNNRFTELVVYAWIMNDNPMGIGQPAYIAGAWYNWGAFAGALRYA